MLSPTVVSDLLLSLSCPCRFLTDVCIALLSCEDAALPQVQRGQRRTPQLPFHSQPTSRREAGVSCLFFFPRLSATRVRAGSPVCVSARGKIVETPVLCFRQHQHRNNEVHTEPMFRSWGELTSCASEVFNLFAEPISATDRVNPAAPSQEATETAEVGLSRAGLECAFYVLFGRYPTPSLIADCFARPLLSVSPARCTSSASPRQSPRDAHGDTTAHVASRFPFAHPDAGRSSHAGAKCFVTRSAYLRFVMLCAEEEDDGFLMERPQGDGTASGTATALSVDGKKVAQLQWWRKFQSVAGAKGFIAASDLLGIDLQGPFTDVPEVLAAQCSMRAGDSLTAAQRKLPASRQAPLVQHVFWMLDRDHDGSVRFDDVRPYLQEC